jgi:hypothetical protein
MGYSVRRRHELLRRRHRQLKVRKLKAKLAAATSKAEREKIIEKIRKISPFIVIPTK